MSGTHVATHVVVDGSNIATEGRAAPSLQQLDDGVRALSAEYGYKHVTVVVDATFGHRIDAKERAAYEEAVLAGELITPPAGAIGRGDAFVLQIADRARDAPGDCCHGWLHAMRRLTQRPQLFCSPRIWSDSAIAGLAR